VNFRLEIIDYLHRIDNLEVLSKILAYIQSVDDPKVYPLTKEDKVGIAAGVSDVEKGHVKPHEEFFSELREWQATK
jgi:predicted transcriptional regulator